MDQKIALIFPAFIHEFTGTETDVLQLFGFKLEPLLREASGFTSLPLYDFDIRSDNFLDDELKTQYITYIFSCAVSDLLKGKQINASFFAGYSMGIYAALYAAGSVSFTDGLDLIQQAYHCIRKTLAPGDYAMGVTGGLEEHDVKNILKKLGPQTRVINSNSLFSFIFSGPRIEIEAIIEAARQEGALQARVMSVSIPYHSPWLNPASDCFKGCLGKIGIQAPEGCLISAFDQRRIKTIGEVIKELVHNIHQPFCWHKTILNLAEQGTSVFIECGAGESLTKINKFIEGEFRTYNLKNIVKLINP